MNKRIFITLLALLAISGGSWAAIRFAKGYRPDLKGKIIAPTGLLVANSYPNGASVFLNDKLTTATDNTLHLPPEEYVVKVIKDGYLPWEKKLQVKKELVVQTNAELFKAAPDLQSLTSTGAVNPHPSPDGTKIAFAVASASATAKNGLWVLTMQPRTFSFTSNLKQIAPQSQKYDFVTAGLFWTPDSKQILAIFNNGENVLLDTEKLTSIDQYQDVSARLPLLIEEWQDQLDLKRDEQLTELPTELANVATASGNMVYFSPDAEKMLYVASSSAILAQNLIPPLPASSSQTEEREIKPNRIYVYDLIEDKNFFIKEAGASLYPNVALLPLLLQQIQQRYSPLFFETVQWYPSSRHLILVEDGKIKMVEYDGTNKVVVYDGPFNDDFVYPWSDGSKLMILTNLNKEGTPSNLYGVEVK